METPTIAGVPVEKLVEYQQKQAAIKESNAVPLPGPLRDAFALVPEIMVGPYAVRPAMDIDFEFLQTLDHPLYRVMIAGQQGEENKMVRGPAAWELCFIFTHTVDDVETLLKQGNDVLRDAAKQQFKKLQLSGLSKLIAAIMRQIEIYWSPVIGYEADEPETEGQVKKK